MFRKTTLKDFRKFVEATKEFPHKSMIVYHDKNCVEAKLQPELVKVLNNPEIDLGDTSKAI